MSVTMTLCHLEAGFLGLEGPFKVCKTADPDSLASNSISEVSAICPDKLVIFLGEGVD